MDKNLAWFRHFNPEAGFDVGNAMARNKYIYCWQTPPWWSATTKGKAAPGVAQRKPKQAWVPCG